MLIATQTDTEDLSADLCLTICNDLLERGWSQQDLFLSVELTRTLAAECRLLNDGGQMKLASVGQGDAQVVRTAIRSDQIAWINLGQSIACDHYLRIMDNVRIALNRSLFLGLDEYESHFAFYAPGASYKKHLDRFRDDDRRTISAVVYLNSDWLTEQGGALRLHHTAQSIVDITPIASRLVLFMSADIVHEVLPASRDRLSLTGWFKRRI